MSGGRFDYKDEYAMSEIFRCDAFLFGGYDKDYKIPNVFEDREISELIFDVFMLIHDYDWYASSDTSKDDYLKSKAEFKKKWLGNNRGIVVKRIIDKAIEEAKQELYETYDIEEAKE